MTADHVAVADAVRSALEVAATVSGGANAEYIPSLASVDPDLLAVAVVDVAGNTYAAGDTDVTFAIESLSKVFTMALAMEQVGADEFRDTIGSEATGLPFNSVIALELNGDRPLSPLVNAGAIASTSLVRATDADDRWRQILHVQSEFAGRVVELSDEVDESEQTTNAHNRAIAYLLDSGGCLYCDPMEAVEVYTRQCSTLVSTTDLATMGATLAAGGINPRTGRRVVSAENVPHILAEMTMEGLYTGSGAWAYNVGLPAKSGVGGGLFAVAPNALAIAAFSPPLDAAGNSVRGQAAVAHVAAVLDLGLYRVRSS